MQVVDHQRHRPDIGLVNDQGDQLLGEERGHVGAAVGGDLAAEQAGDRGPPGGHRGGPDLQRVEKRVQRQLLAELVPRSPEDLAAPLCPVVRARTGPAGGGRQRRTDQRGLTDARLALDEHGVATASGELSQ